MIIIVISFSFLTGCRNNSKNKISIKENEISSSSTPEELAENEENSTEAAGISAFEELPEEVINFGQLQKGQYITFGKYEQDGDLDNGKEPIEWEVLSIEPGQALLLSKYALDFKKYDEGIRQQYFGQIVL